MQLVRKSHLSPTFVDSAPRRTSRSASDHLAGQFIGARWLFGLVVCCLTACTAEAQRSPTPQWIWGVAGANEQAPRLNCTFRKSVALSGPVKGRIELTCDDRYELFVNGRRIGSGNNWQTLDRYDVTQFLKDGENEIRIECRNGEGPAGLAARLVVQPPEGAEVVHVSDASWEAAMEPPGGWDPQAARKLTWNQAYVLGPFLQAAPWGDAVATTTPLKTRRAIPNRSASEPLELLDGDRVVLLGNTLIEREQRSAYWETMLAAHYPGRDVTFRNLGWSGDTVFGTARARFGSVADGFTDLVASVQEAEPTVIFVAYGGNESFQGAAGLPEFVSGLERLLDVLQDTGAMVALVTPPPQENLGPPLPDPAARNRDVALYAEAIREVARQRDCMLVDLHAKLAGERSSPEAAPFGNLTSDGLHFTALGYWYTGQLLQECLQAEPFRWNVEVDPAAGTFDAVGTQIEKFQVVVGGVSFSAVDRRLPPPAAPGEYSADETAAQGEAACQMRVRGLAPGRYSLSIGGQQAIAADADQWAAGVRFSNPAAQGQVERLREAIQKKNELFFHRWRPQNETYLFLFRKHEQGNNASEIPQFDPLIASVEATIREHTQPRTHTFQLQPVEDPQRDD
ncbi:MAG: GDSL-type esterase/lipase family protein [Pirellulales bacterium]